MKTIIIASVLATAFMAGVAIYILNPWSGKEIEKTCTTYGNRVEKQCIEDYIGLTQQEAIDKAKRYKYVPKIVSIDGMKQPVTDEGSMPLYLEVENDLVVRGHFQK